MNPSITVRIILLIACVGPVSLGQETSSLDQEALAEIAKGIEEAETLTWTVQVYRESSGNNGQPLWTMLGRSELSFQAPNLYRDTRYDKQENVGSVEIINTETNKTLRVDYEAKKASWLNQPTNVYGPEDPITNLAQLVKNAPLPAIGTRDVDGVTVNVLRYVKGRSMDLWINAKTSRLVGMSIPGADVFDPLSADATDGPKMGQLRKNIVYGESLDSDLFEMRPPEGFAVTQAPTRIPETYRAVMADLTVKDVAAEDLPAANR